MKKITLWLFALFMTMQINAQVSSYSFVAGTAGVLGPMTASTQLVASNSDDGASAVTSIGFTFNFAGVDYTQFSANANGLVRLGATAVTTQWTNTAANALTASPVIMPYWDDLATGSLAGGGKVHYVLTGTAPNRKLIVEWFVTIPRNTTGAANAKFQCILNETSNIIEFVYGSGMLVNTPTTGATVGLATSATLFNTVDVVTNTNSNATFKVDNTAAIASGTTYTFTPPSCPGSTGLTTTNITASSATITWLTPTPTAPSAGYEYVVSSSAIAPTGSGTATTATSASVSGLLSNTTYFVYVRSNCGSEFGTWIAVGTFKTLCDSVTDFIQNFDTSTTGVGNLPTCWDRAGTSANVYTTTGSVAPMSPANRLYMNISATTTAYALMPPVNNLQAATHKLKFKVYATAASKKVQVGYFTNPADTSTFVLIQELDLPSTAASSALEFTVIPTAIPAGISRLVFGLIAGSATTVYIDDVKWEVNSSCIEPTALSTASVTSNSAQLSWVNGGPETEWQVQYGLTGFTFGAGTIVSSVTTNPYLLSGLTPDTSYQYYVRGICTGTIYSSWSGPYTFRTLCVGVTDFIQTFETSPTGVGNLPLCWSSAGSTGNVYNTTGSVSPMSPANRLYMNISATTTAFATLPPVTNLQAETHRLKFKTYATAAAKKLRIGYFTNPANVSTFVIVEEIDLPSTTAATATEFTVVPYLGSVPGITNLVFALVPGSATTVYIDDVKWEENSSCLEPTALNVLALTNTSAQLNWVNGGSETEWQVQYGLTGFSLGTGTNITGITANPYTLNGLTANTTYQYYVRGVCAGPTYSSWSGPFTFKTLCNGVTSFVETFDTYSGSGVNNLPDCWSRGGSSITTYITTGAIAPMSPSNRLYIFASGITPTEGYAILPPVTNLQLSTHRLRFKAFATSSPRDLIVGYLTNPSDVSSFVAIQTFTVAGTVVANTQEYVVVPTGLPVGITNLAFKNAPATGLTAAIYIDDVAWEPIPACANPTGVSSSAVTSNSATIAWSGNPTDVSWQIEYGAPGFVLGTGTIVAASTNPFILTGLASSTVFQYYVRSICAGPITSTNSFAGTFTTLCAPVTPTYVQDFATFPPLCWTRADAGTIASGPVGTGAGFWFADGFLNSGFNGAINANLYQENRVAWMVSPIFNLSAGGYQVKYDVGATQFNTTTPAVLDADDKVDFLMSVDGGVTWTSLELYNGTNIPSNISTTKVYNIPAVTSSNVLFAFRADEGPLVSTTDWDFFVDNFKVDLPALTAPACASNIVASQGAGCGNYPLTLTWNATATANGYRLNMGTTTGGTDIASNVDLGSVLTYTIASPVPGTTYYYTIIPYNTVGNATGCTELSFATPSTTCACIPPYTTGVAFDDYFSSFALQGTTLNNNSGTSTTAPSYNYYTGLPNYTATLSQGTTYTANTAVGFGNAAFSVWIDFNDNSTFETSERVGFTTTNIPTPSGSFNLTIPCTATVGTHKMRVRMIYAATGSTIDPCASAIYGETEDYDVTIAPLAAPTGAATQAFCGAPTVANLVAVGATGATIKWYDAATLGTELPSTTVLVTGTTYYASQTVGTCESATRLAVAVTVNPIPATPTGAASQTYCPADADDIADLVVTGSNLVWYDAATGGNVLPTTTVLTTTTYYVASNIGTCESPRLAIATTVDCSPAPCLTATYGQWPSSTVVPNTAFCDGYTVQNITTCAYASEYAVVTVVAGQTYKFASSIATDVITLSTDGGATAVLTGLGSVTWVATVSGNIRFYAHTAGCGAADTCRVKTVVCGTITADSPDYANLQFPATLTFTQGGNGTVYGQIYEGGLTDVAPNIVGQAPGITAWVGISSSNTNPNTWTNWVPATWNSGHVSNNDEYQATIGATLAPGTYYYATRFRLNSGAYVYGGIDSSNNGNFWNGTVYNSGVLTVTLPVAPGNDNCPTPVGLIAGGIFGDNDIDTSNIGATLSLEYPGPTCGNLNFSTTAKDVWYSVVVPASGSITIETGVTSSGGTGIDTVIAAYTGTCGTTLTAVGCDDDGATESTYGLSKLSLTGQTPGSSLKIRVFGYDGASGAFSISAYDASLSTDSFDNSNFTFYPNPVRDVLNLSYSENITKIQVINLLGQEVKTNSVNATQAQVDMSNLPTGTYLVKVTANDKAKTIKVIKQ